MKVCMRRGVGMALALALVFINGTLQAGAVDARSKMLGERAAEANAYVRLVQHIKGVHLQGYTEVSRAVADFDAQDVRLDAFVRGARVVAKGCDDDGFAWAVVRISISEVIENVDAIQRRLVQDGQQKYDFSRERIEVRRRPVTVTAIGFGAATRDARVNPSIAPSGEQREFSLVAQARSAASKLGEDYLTRDFVMAVRGAEMLAIEGLAREIKGMQIFGNFFAFNGVVEEDLAVVSNEAFVRGAVLSSLEAESDGTVSAGVRLRLRSAVSNSEEIVRNIQGKISERIRIDERTRETILTQTGRFACGAGEVWDGDGLLPGTVH